MKFKKERKSTEQLNVSLQSQIMLLTQCKCWKTPRGVNTTISSGLADIFIQRGGYVWALPASRGCFLCFAEAQFPAASSDLERPGIFRRSQRSVPSPGSNFGGSEQHLNVNYKLWWPTGATKLRLMPFTAWHSGLKRSQFRTIFAYLDTS